MKCVIKLTDPECSGHVYCIKNCIPAFGSQEFFSVDCVFENEQEAKKHIKTMLKSGWYRPDITPTNFEIVEVKQYKGLDFGLFYYTKRGYEQFKGLSGESEDTE